jgi:hypothetical protein
VGAEARKQESKKKIHHRDTEAGRRKVREKEGEGRGSKRRTSIWERSERGG